MLVACLSLSHPRIHSQDGGMSRVEGTNTRFPLQRLLLRCSQLRRRYFRRRIPRFDCLSLTPSTLRSHWSRRGVRRQSREHHSTRYVLRYLIGTSSQPSLISACVKLLPRPPKFMLWNRQHLDRLVINVQRWSTQVNSDSSAICHMRLLLALDLKLSASVSRRNVSGWAVSL